jgi:hypothetical protein
MEYNTNNISTIAVFIYMLISPILVQYGYNIQQEVFVGAFVGIFGLLLAIWSSRNPNTIAALGNQPNTVDPTEPVLNDEYECDE